MLINDYSKRQEFYPHAAETEISIIDKLLMRDGSVVDTRYFDLKDDKIKPALVDPSDLVYRLTTQELQLIEINRFGYNLVEEQFKRCYLTAIRHSKSYEKYRERYLWLRNRVYQTVQHEQEPGIIVGTWDRQAECFRIFRLVHSQERDQLVVRLCELLERFVYRVFVSEAQLKKFAVREEEIARSWKFYKGKLFLPDEKRTFHGEAHFYDIGCLLSEYWWGRVIRLDKYQTHTAFPQIKVTVVQ